MTVMNAFSNCICNPVTGEHADTMYLDLGKVVRCCYRWLNDVRRGDVEVGSQNGWRRK